MVNMFLNIFIKQDRCEIPVDNAFNLDYYIPIVTITRNRSQDHSCSNACLDEHLMNIGTMRTPGLKGK